MTENKNQREIIIIDPTVVAITEKSRVAAYCRVSSSSDDQLDSFAAQMDCYSKLIAEHEDEWQLVDIYADEGISALSMNKRDNFNRLMRDAKKGKIDLILTKSISRFSRNTKDCLESVRKLKNIGVTVQFEKERFDTSKMESELLLTMYSGGAQQESMSISSNTRLGCKMRMKNGTFVASSTPLGYQLIDRKLCVDNEQEYIVRGIFSSYLSGNGVMQIAKDLNKRQIPTKDSNAKWCAGTILYILNNERYLGDALLQKSFTTDTLPFKRMLNNGERDRYYVENEHPSIISKEDFHRVQTLMAERNKKFARPQRLHTYALSKHIYCGDCGKFFVRNVCNQKTYWVCHNHITDKDICPVTQIPEQQFYNAFIRMYNKLRPAADRIFGVMAEQLYSLKSLQNRNNTQISGINKEIANLTEQNHVMNDLKVKNLIDSAFFIAQTNELTRQIRKLRAEKSRLMESEDDDELLAGTQNILDILEGGPAMLTEFDAELFEQIIDKIIVITDEEVRFRLINGLELSEQIERVKR